LIAFGGRARNALSAAAPEQREGDGAQVGDQDRGGLGQRGVLGRERQRNQASGVGGKPGGEADEQAGGQRAE
jgi:hypothetical protein